VPELLIMAFMTLREGHILKVFGNGVLRRMFGLKRDEVIGGWRKLHNEKPPNLYSLPNIITMTNEMDRACGTHGDKKECI
jgi:hypothetical protein